VQGIRRGTPPEGGDTGSVLVTQDNLNDDEIQAVLNPSCADPPTQTS
jgi:ribose transport system substrate-binding protein